MLDSRLPLMPMLSDDDDKNRTFVVSAVGLFASFIAQYFSTKFCNF